MQHKWFVYHRPSGAPVRLFCLPYAGGNAAIYRQWPDALMLDADVYPVELPGRGLRLSEPPLHELPPLVESLAQAMEPLLDRPFALFGYSMGSLISFELARFLRRQYGLSPVQIFVAAHRAPHLPDRDPFTHMLAEPEFLQKLQALGGTALQVLEHEELREVVLPFLRADFTICKTYTYRPDLPFDCPLLAFGGIDDLVVNRAEMEAWGAHTSGPFTFQLLPGNHFFLNTMQQHLLRAVAHALRQAAPIAQLAA